ncbi:hypothetical protein GCM10010517_57760 [Streptosporangium fragile]|uniref:Uncharacterized protein n=1 Tax=Streptosporangium fragile TaxID=46186 RepID=A0ABP6IKE8_9ACTN
MAVAQTHQPRTRTAPRSTAPAPTEQRTAEREAAEPATGDRSYTLNLPMLTVQVRPPHMPHLRMPHVRMPYVNRQEASHAVHTARTFLPPPERLAYYGGLGALAVAGLIEWPVAAAIGVGTVIAQRARRESRSAEPAARLPGPAPRKKASPAPTTSETSGTSGTSTARKAGSAPRAARSTARSAKSAAPAAKTAETTKTAETAKATESVVKTAGAPTGPRPSGGGGEPG